MLLYNTYESMSIAAAHFFTIEYDRAVTRHGKFVVALSGGNTPRHMYELLASHVYSLNIDWKKVFVFFSDERYVPQNNKDSNYKMANDNLLKEIDIPAKNIFAIPTSSTPEKDALKYETSLRKMFKTKPTFDLLMLGMGADGHTASLFPGSPLLKETRRWVKDVYVPATDTHRITFTLPMINSARQTLILVSGHDKKPLIKKLIAKRSAGKLPVQLVKGNITWMVDEGLY
ncbi:MAG TPA: 6-phosphogluconolactonase [Ferruginibacter sp.]|nr:6-phosphogluconolactonase [Ferruginibacter sp.]